MSVHALSSNKVWPTTFLSPFHFIPISLHPGILQGKTEAQRKHWSGHETEGPPAVCSQVQIVIEFRQFLKKRCLQLMSIDCLPTGANSYAQPYTCPASECSVKLFLWFFVVEVFLVYSVCCSVVCARVSVCFASGVGVFSLTPCLYSDIGAGSSLSVSICIFL